MPLAATCPECGTRVLISVDGDLLQLTGTPYLRTVRAGLTLVLCGTVARSLLAIATVLQVLLDSPGSALAEPQIYIMALANIAVLPIVLRGYWLYTTPDPDATSPHQHNRLRAVARFISALHATLFTGFILITAVICLSETSGVAAAQVATDHPNLAIFSIAAAVATIAWVAQNIAIMRYTHHLARRIPDAGLERQTNARIIQLPLLQTVAIFPVGPLVAIALYCTILRTMRQRITTILAARTDR
jgi:hypothetical protein